MKKKILKEIISKNLSKSKLKERAKLAKDVEAKQMGKNKKLKKEKRKVDIKIRHEKCKRN